MRSCQWGFQCLGASVKDARMGLCWIFATVVTFAFGGWGLGIFINEVMTGKI